MEKCWYIGAGNDGGADGNAAGNPNPGGIAMIRIDQIFLIRDSSQHQVNAALLYK